MSAKRKSDSQNPSDKKKRKVIGLKQKLCMISKYEAGSSKAKLSREYVISESTVRHIIQHAQKYKEMGQTAGTTTGLQTTRNRTIPMIEMERLLSIWIEDCNQKRIPVNQMAIKAKALSLYQTVQKKRAEENGNEGDTKETFCASSGWFDRFKRRSGIYSAHGVVDDADNTDENASATYPADLKKYIEDGGYTEEQIFNVDETGLFWKKIPNKTYVAKKQLHEFETDMNGTIEEIRQLGVDLGLTKIHNNSSSQEEFFETHNKINYNNTDQNCMSDNQQEDNDSVNVKTTKEITIKELSRIFHDCETLKQKILDTDPNVERAMKVLREIENTIICYRLMYQEKSKENVKQTSLLKYFAKKT